MSPESHETDWIVQVNESLNPLPSLEQQQWEKRSIYRVPTHIAKLNPEAYRPQVVSFGPYHHGEDHLLPMEEHKRRALTCFLMRSKKRYEPFLESLRGVAQELEESYDALDPKWKESRQFLELMITDGCFMLEIMRMAAVGKENNGYSPNDPIFSAHGMAYIMPYIIRDMLMLENQLPMLVLERLVAVEGDGREGNEFIIDLILNFHSAERPINGIGHCLHVLDVYRKSMLLPERESKKGPSHWRKDDVIIRSVTALYKHGIRFKRSDNRSLNDISFSRGVLRLPMIVVDDTTESVYLNLIAFEQFHAGAGDEVSSYIFFMASIINTELDIARLGAEGIIQNAIGRDKEVTKLFSSLCDGMTFGPHSGHYTVHADVSMYCKKPWNKWRTIVSNTVIELSLLGGFFIFVLTFIQTVYSGLSYHE